MSLRRIILLYIIPLALIIRCLGLLFFQWEIEYFSGKVMYTETSVSGFPLPDHGIFDPLDSEDNGPANSSTNKIFFLVNLLFVFLAATIIHRYLIGGRWPIHTVNKIILSTWIIAIYIFGGWFTIVYEGMRWHYDYGSWPEDWSIVKFHLGLFH